MMDYMPTSMVMNDVSAVTAWGVVFGLGVTLAFWLVGYATRSVLVHLRGGI